MRKPRLLGDGTSVYHVMSRVVDRRFVLGPEERSHLVDTMRKLAAFAGTRVFTYCVMSNHFHILVEIPDREGLEEALDDDALLSRVRSLYGRAFARGIARELHSARSSGSDVLAHQIRGRFLRRMGDLSCFVKELKQRFTQWFNTRKGRRGTLWEERFKSVLVEDAQDALLTMGAYIDLNPVRAGIVSDPADYRDCGYAAAAAGRKSERSGIARMLQAFYSAPSGEGMGAHRRPSWREASKAYRALLFGSGEQEVNADGETVRCGIPPEKIAEALAKGHRLGLAEVLRCRVRYFGDGLVFGTVSFIETVFNSARSRFGKRRKTGSRKMRGADWGELRTMRDLRVNVFGPETIQSVMDSD